MFFSFGKLSRFHIIPFLVPIFYISMTYVIRDEMKINQVDNGNKFEDYEFAYFLQIFSSKIFAVIIYFINKFLMKETEEKGEKSESIKVKSTRSLRVYHLNVNSNNKLKMFYNILIISILEVLYQIGNMQFINLLVLRKELIEIKLGFIIFVPIFSYFILKTKYYRHHFLSILIGLFGFIFVVLSLFFQDEEQKLSFMEHFNHFMFSIPYSLSIVLINHLFIYYLIYPFTFLFIDGIFCVFFSFIYILIKSFIFMKNKEIFINNMKNIFFIFGEWKLFGLLLWILLFSFLYFLFIAITLYYFSPILLVMTDILSQIIMWIVDTLIFECRQQTEENIAKYNYIFKAIGYFFIVISVFIFNEIIICKFCKMDYNISKKIRERAISDAIQKSISSNNESVLLSINIVE